VKAPERKAQECVQVVFVMLGAHIFQGGVVLQFMLTVHHLDVDLRQGLVDAGEALQNVCRSTSEFVPAGPLLNPLFQHGPLLLMGTCCNSVMKSDARIC